MANNISHLTHHTSHIKKILFVEDDINLAFVTQDNLEAANYGVTHCENGQIAWEIFQKNDFDICVFDVMLPILDGFSLAKKIREQNKNIPIIFLSAKSLKEDRIEGLKLGADDYLTKPFSIEELLLKIQIFLRRNMPINAENIVSDENIDKNNIKIGKYFFDFENLTLSLDAQPQAQIQAQPLTLREAELIRLFAQNLNKTLKREEILLKIWGDDDYFMGRSLDVFISRLRKFFVADENITIKNIRNVGFKLEL